MTALRKMPPREKLQRQTAESKTPRWKKIFWRMVRERNPLWVQTLLSS